MTGPTLSQIKDAAVRIKTAVVETPVLSMMSARWAAILPEGLDVTVKLELFQQAGSFKARGAYLGINGLDEDQRGAGVVAASGGNHALAVAWAAKAAGVQATISMPKAVDLVRIEGCKALGAKVVLCEDMAAAFAVMEQGAKNGKTLMHPFEGEHMTLGAATCGMEYLTQAPDIDTFVIPIGGGGLISGMACAIKQARPDATVIGVEPVGADSMKRSFEAGHAVTLDVIDTIADSLGSPKAMPYSYGVAQAYVDKIVHVTDAQMIEGMKAYYNAMRLMAEPACAASLAAVCGPLADELRGKKVGIVACGSNIGLDRFKHLTNV